MGKVYYILLLVVLGAYISVSYEDATESYDAAYYSSYYYGDYESTEETLATKSPINVDPFEGYDDEGVVTVERNQIGFLRSEPTGINSVRKAIVNPSYIISASETYGCLSRVDAKKGFLDPKDVTNKAQQKKTGIADAIIENTKDKDAVGKEKGVSDPVPERKKSFKEIQEEKKKQRDEDKKILAIKKPKFQLGPDCEAIACRYNTFFAISSTTAISFAYCSCMQCVL